VVCDIGSPYRVPDRPTKGPGWKYRRLGPHIPGRRSRIPTCREIKIEYGGQKTEGDRKSSGVVASVTALLRGTFDRTVGQPCSNVSDPRSILSTSLFRFQIHIAAIHVEHTHRRSCHLREAASHVRFGFRSAASAHLRSRFWLSDESRSMQPDRSEGETAPSFVSEGKPFVRRRKKV
jgi:hypothetical protein